MVTLFKNLLKKLKLHVLVNVTNIAVDVMPLRPYLYLSEKFQNAISYS